MDELEWWYRKCTNEIQTCKLAHVRTIQQTEIYLIFPEKDNCTWHGEA